MNEENDSQAAAPGANEQEAQPNPQPAAGSEPGDGKGQGADSSSLLGGAGLEGNKPEDGNKGDSKGDSKPSDTGALPDSPAGYQIEFSAETQVDGQLLGQFQAWAHENKIPLSQATQLAKAYEARVATLGQEMRQAQAQAYAQQVDQWLKETEDLPEFKSARGESMKALDVAMTTFGTPELRKLLDETGLGNHPLVVGTFIKIGKSLSEPKTVRGSQPAGEKSTAEVLYPDLKA